jgi:hypothetical protein
VEQVMKDLAIEASVGIFWKLKDSIVSKTTTLNEAEVSDDFIDSPDSHVEYWEIVRKQKAELFYYEYDEIPRGRVVFSKNNRCFYVYMDKTFFTKIFKQLIIDDFKLHGQQIKFMSDQHYTTDHNDLDQLFD